MNNTRLLNEQELENVTGGISDSLYGFLVLLTMFTRMVILEKLNNKEKSRNINITNVQNDLVRDMECRIISDSKM